ncbi:DHA2 family efflux MFS transporter permease subunit [Pseudonocardia abyssalis]|uniref:DHA2 family efflux MFS transporter permease subunit n=1 Tax=Pseudonocardia abyssalis TaxID=2792008 RepID=A0ABS6UWH8_9PSEU|nr:DHA2 family efflux MFS transporter permease subunit [Pseudonocardia abyssalis]MBW0117403.1 DHA2 family efflux MFS transporter permease subunit [Pseudonocardia abyssalis]MBW0136599.1 DHA2 family efflux MFS transporter permease subunit [Pseudonocardia abyssalis]
MTTRQPVRGADGTPANPWPALWALVLGFFMILVDSTIVSVATPAIMADLGVGVDPVVWVTSAYLLAYAVPLLVTGRLGDRFGPRRVYLLGLVVFTLASLWCGLTDTLGELIVARVVQGLGAALITPQTMAVITRTFPAENRGRAMSLWGAVAGIATLVGPILGGVLVDGLGWEWIFFINVPVGIVGFVLAVRLVPELPTHVRRFDLVGVALSAVGMFLLVFGIQEGQTYDWGTIVGPISVWSLIVAGVVVLAGFVLWQRRAAEPLVRLALFRDRNFSLANVVITTVGFTVTAMVFPILFYAQAVLGLSPTGSALLLVPMAVVSGGLAPVVGRLSDRVHPRVLAGVGLASWSVSLVWLAAVMGPDTPIWQLLLPIALLGVANGFVWAPVSTTATRNLPPADAGAGSGVYNTTRQVGAVLGSAAIAALIASRLVANLPAVPGGGASETVAQLPEALHAGFATAMAQALLLPAGVVLIGLVAALGFALPRHLARSRPATGATTVTPVG